MLRKDSRMDNTSITVITLVAGLALMILYLVCCWYLLDKRPKQIWLTKKALERSARTTITDEEARIWLAMRNARERGFWDEKEHAHE